jgi:hypothetical protein
MPGSRPFWLVPLPEIESWVCSVCGWRNSLTYRECWGCHTVREFKIPAHLRAC